MRHRGRGDGCDVGWDVMGSAAGLQFCWLQQIILIASCSWVPSLSSVRGGGMGARDAAFRAELARRGDGVGGKGLSGLGAAGKHKVTLSKLTRDPLCGLGLCTS